MSQATFAKKMREKERREKAAAKMARRAERQAASAEAAAEAPAPAPAVDEEAIIAALGELHAKFDRGDMSFEDFSEAKDELTQRLMSV